MTPRQEAIAFMIWAYCDPLGWDTTIADAAEHLGVNQQQVIGVARVKGWIDRFRKARPTRSLAGTGWYGSCGIESL